MLSVLVCHGDSTDGGFCCAAKQTHRSYGHACLLDKTGDSAGYKCVLIHYGDSDKPWKCMLAVLVGHGDSTGVGWCCAAKQTRRSY